MTLLELIAAAAGGSVVGSWVTAKIINRRLNTAKLLQIIDQDLRLAFRTGFLTAADILTLEGHDEIAGRLRHTATAANLANDD